MSCGASRRLGSGPTLLWLWCRLVATVLIGPLAWEPPYAAGGGPKKTKKKKIRLMGNMKQISEIKDKQWEKR